jgi:radical SAM protein with 4Fe4S-binding SPASM domain
MAEPELEFLPDTDEGLSKGIRPTVYWYPSFRCNLACKHCSVNSSPNVDTSGDLTLEEALSVVGQLKELDAGWVILSGGEFLFRPDSLRLLEALIDAGINLGIESNGLLFTEDFVRLVQRGSSAGLQVNTTVSLDGGTSETHETLRGKNTFERTLRGMRFLADSGVRFSIQCVVNRTNVQSIPNLFAEASRLMPHLHYLIFAFLHPVGRGFELQNDMGLGMGDYREAYGLIAEGVRTFGGKTVVKVPPAMIPPEYTTKLFGAGKQSGCTTSCAFPTLGILPNGNVSICALTQNDSTVSFGNVKTDTLLDIWRRTRMDIVRRDYLSAEKLKGICSDCTFKHVCKGGCRAFAYDESGDLQAPHPLCDALDKRGEFPPIYRLSVKRKLLGQLPTLPTRPPHTIRRSAS